MLIRYAYQLQTSELIGGEGWLDSERFDIVAKAENDATQNEVRAMLQSLLADRFRLKVMAEFASHLTPLVGRHVVDRTGASGYFDMDFDFTHELQPPPPPPGVPDPFDRQSFQTIFSVLPEQLGLKLEAQRGNVEVMVIDHAERPVPD